MQTCLLLCAGECPVSAGGNISTDANSGSRFCGRAANPDQRPSDDLTYRHRGGSFCLQAAGEQVGSHPRPTALSGAVRACNPLLMIEAIAAPGLARARGRETIYHSSRWLTRACGQQPGTGFRRRRVELTPPAALSEPL